MPVPELHPEEQAYLQLMNPPDFKVEFTKVTKNESGRYKISDDAVGWGFMPPRVNDYTFGAKAKQLGVRPYSHNLTIEYYAIGKELLGNKYKLLDYQTRTFSPCCSSAPKPMP